MTTQSRTGLHDTQRGVQKAYTEEQVLADIRAKHGGGISLRHIAAEYGEPITFGDIKRILDGVLPKCKEKRDALHLPDLVPVPVCPVHHVAHLRRTCPKNQPAPRARWMRCMGHSGGEWINA